MEQFDKFDNYNFFLERGSEYQEAGRVQTEEEAREVDKVVKKVLDDNRINYTTLPIEGAAKHISGLILNALVEMGKI
jgi:hypothetical protein